MTKEEIFKIIEGKGINLIRHLFVGFDGISRGRVVHKENLAESLNNGTGVSASVQEFNDLDELVPGGSGPVGEVNLNIITKLVFGGQVSSLLGSKH